MTIQRIEADPEKVQYGKADINAVVNAFEMAMELRMPRNRYQREAAQTLLKQRGYDRVMGAVAYVANTRDEK